MITALEAQDGTKIDQYIKDKCKELEESIKISMELGYSYLRYSNTIPECIETMLKELGYNIEQFDGAFNSFYLISWSKVSQKDKFKCN